MCDVFLLVIPQNEAETMVFTMFLQQRKRRFWRMSETKSNIRMAKIQKRCILRCFWPVGCENVCFEKRSKHRNLQCFLLVPRTKQCYLRCFLTLAAPKSSQNIGIYDVFTTNRKANVAKTPLFATLWQHNMSEIVYFTVFLDHLFKNTGIYSVFRKHMHKTS